jgi:hypothetical protein
MRLALVDEECSGGYLDPEAFAIRVRELAVEAYRFLRDPDATYWQAVEVSRQFEELHHQRRSGNSPEKDIDRWLRNAARQVREYRPSPCAAQAFG